MTTRTGERCACCGAAISNPDRVDVTVRLPDGVVPTEETNVNAAFLRVPTGQAFVRCLLPVALTGGTTVVYMAWMETPQADFQRAVEAWKGSSWDGTVLHGKLGNDLKPWTEALRGTEVMATVRAADEPPTITNSEHPLIRRILTEAWDRDSLLSWFPGPLPLPIQVRVGEHWSVERGEGMVAGLGKGGWRFGGPGRSVFVDVLTDASQRSAGDYLSGLLENAPEVPRDQSLYVPTADDITHAFWVETAADGRSQHEFYAHVVRRGTALSMGAFYTDPDDHKWAMHVLRSVRHHG
ncbi:DUF2199 domain-containing protein [Lentzea sp. NPDC051208]|uniref:DUF2199 domain-containing protein n=1 Tax=Lentzea sp. NPDC051208 TaxID=3154642 RepID=UPI003448B355